MNYRHAFHAGNFADVMKHAVLARIILYLREKTTPFRIIDTHAGPGLTDLTGPEASRTGEWRDGVGRLLSGSVAPQFRVLLAPYLDVLASFNPDGRLVAYPGSPLFARALLREQDRLVACELEPKAAASLSQHCSGDRRTKAIAIDGWTALTAYVPPKERRGVVLVDPPFESSADFSRLATGLAAAYSKWPTGIYLLWYPIKDIRETRRLAQATTRLGIPKILRAELTVGQASEQNRLFGSGLLVVNPPWRLERDLTVMMPALSLALRRTAVGTANVDWLVHEK
jgi:23S rRNA (adenine2030-N6)-methyltransferase